MKENTVGEFENLLEFEERTRQTLLETSKKLTAMRHALAEIIISEFNSTGKGKFLIMKNPHNCLEAFGKKVVFRIRALECRCCGSPLYAFYARICATAEDVEEIRKEVEEIVRKKLCLSDKFSLSIDISHNFYEDRAQTLHTQEEAPRP